MVGNTELLAQKQKLLAAAVGETKEKLATLKTAYAMESLGVQGYDSQGKMRYMNVILGDLNTKCGDIFRRITWNNKGKKYAVCRCYTRVTQGPEACDARTIKETDLQEAVVEDINQLIDESIELKEIIKRNIEKVITGNVNEKLKKLTKKC